MFGVKEGKIMPMPASYSPRAAAMLQLLTKVIYQC